jgi:PadR family transcriptional regulator, regulatory protein PadR
MVGNKRLYWKIKEVKSMQIEKSMLTGNLVLIILSLLSESDKYGYELISDLRTKSYDAIQLKSGTLYPLLHSLEVEKFVSSYEKIAEGNKIRKYYHLTHEGKAHFEVRTKEWNSLVKTVNGILSGSGVVYG